MKLCLLPFPATNLTSSTAVLDKQKQQTKEQEQKLKKQHEGELGAGEERRSGSENWSLLCDLRNSAFPDEGEA